MISHHVAHTLTVQIAVRMLNGIPLYGQQLSVVGSQHPQIKLPRADSEEVRKGRRREEGDGR